MILIEALLLIFSYTVKVNFKIKIIGMVEYNKDMFLKNFSRSRKARLNTYHVILFITKYQ